MEKYLKDNMVLRKLRWDVPINDGLVGEEDILEWYVFFNSKGKEVMEFLIKKKQRKMRMIESQIKDFRDKIEPFQKSTENAKHMGDLQKNMQKKNLENRNINKNKYLRDVGGYQKKQVFRWQTTVGVVENAAQPNSPPGERNTAGDKNVGFKTPQAPRQQNHSQYTAVQTKRDQPPLYYSESMATREFSGITTKH